MYAFKSTDRCDRCGARALHVARKPLLMELMFCGHHFTQYRDALKSNYWLIESYVTPAEDYQVPVLTE
jgi:ribosomal protein L37E